MVSTAQVPLRSAFSFHGEGHCHGTEGPLPTEEVHSVRFSLLVVLQGCGYTLEDTVFLVRNLARVLQRPRASITRESVIMKDWLT